MKALSLDKLLSEEDRLPVVFQTEGALLGFLDPNTSGEPNLREGARVELPYWLAADLAEKRAVALELPKHYSSKMRDEILAGGQHINLREYSFYFYEVGLQLSRLLRDSDLLRSLRLAFCGDRFKALMMHCLTRGHDDNTEFAQNLPFAEAVVHQCGSATMDEMDAWKNRRAFIIQRSALLQSVSGRGVGPSDANKRPRIY